MAAAVKNAFELIIGGETHLFITSSSWEKDEWMQQLNKAIQDAQLKKVFGVPLKDLMTKNPAEAGQSIPTFVRQACEHMEKNCKPNIETKQQMFSFLFFWGTNNNETNWKYLCSSRC
jgi:hypothetical protein